MVAESNKKKIAKRRVSKNIRLWVKAKFIGFRRYLILYLRSKVQQNTNQSILQLDGVNDRTAASYYYGKRVCFIYKTTSGQKDKRFKVH